MNKIFEVDMMNSKGELASVEFEIILPQSRWKFAETMSSCMRASNGDSFKYTILMAEAIFPAAIVNHNFKSRKIDDINWTTKELIEEFFCNDPEVLTALISTIVGFTNVARTKGLVEKKQI